MQKRPAQSRNGMARRAPAGRASTRARPACRPVCGSFCIALSAAYLLVPARCVPVKAKVSWSEMFGIVFGAVWGRDSVTRRWSVVAEASEARFDSARFAPITGREARTDLVVPPQV